MASVAHPIKLVALRTGLSAHAIRIWEKRYGAVKPERTDTNRRLYSREQIERLALLRELRQAGQSLGHVAKLPTPKLRQLAPNWLAPIASPCDRCPEGLQPVRSLKGAWPP